MKLIQNSRICGVGEFQETPTESVSSKQSPGQCAAADLLANIQHKDINVHALLQIQRRDGEVGHSLSQLYKF